MGEKDTLQNAAPKKEIVAKQLTDIDKERILVWREKQSQTNPSFQFQENDEGAITTGIPSNYELEEANGATICTATGSLDSSYATNLLILALNAAPLTPGNNKADEANALLATLLSLKPQDEIEGMLITRLITLHKQYMNIMSRAWKTDSVDFEGSYINHATKLMRLYNETLEALNRYRRKGEQKITVQHVHVSNGGQAVVSGEFHQGGGSNKK